MASEQIEFGFGGNTGHRRPCAAVDVDDNFFIGLQPGDAAQRSAKHVADDLQRRLGVSEPIRPLHVTMQELGRYRVFPPTLLLEKKDALSVIRFEPFAVTFDEIMSFRRNDGKSPLVLCASRHNAELFDLRRKIFEAQQPPGIALARTPAFTPHMTLFYTRKTTERQRLSVPIEWVVRQFCIIRSYHGDTEHGVLWNWPACA